MNWIKNVFKNLRDGIKWCFTPAGQAYLDKTTDLVETLVARYLPLIEVLAAQNPTTAKALETAEAYGAKLVPGPHATLGEILRQTAAFVIQTEFPKVSGSVINLAIETAVQVAKAKAA